MTEKYIEHEDIFSKRRDILAVIMRAGTLYVRHSYGASLTHGYIRTEDVH